MDGSSSVNWLNQLARKMTGTAGVVVVGPQEDTTHTMNTQRVLASLPACPPTSRGMCAADGILDTFFSEIGGTENQFTLEH